MSTDTLSLEKVKTIDQRTKDTVFGFIKQSQTLLPSNESYYNIVPLICHIILLFYCKLEIFTVYDKDEFEYNEYENILTKKRNKRCTAYGNIDIYGNNLFIYEWTFKILNSGGDIYIGIDSSYKGCINSRFTSGYNINKHYAYGAEGYKYDFIDNRDKYGYVFKNNDIIKMILNIKQKTISFYHHKDIGIAFENIDFTENKKYNMAVSMYGKHDSVQLLDFQQIYYK